MLGGGGFSRQFRRMDASFVPQSRPDTISRLLLRLIGMQGRRRRRRIAAPDAGPPSDLAAAALARLRAATDRPCFPQALSSLQVRRVVALRVPGATELRPARLYVPHGTVRGVVLFLHGGGFVHCGLNSHHGICCRLARQSGAAVLSFDYRLAPEHRFPAAVEDCRAALAFLAGEAWRWGGGVAVAGDSAGGNLAAVLSQEARRSGPPLAVQVLFYPSLHGARETDAHLWHGEGYMLTSDLLTWYGENYIARQEDLKDPRFAPALTRDLRGVAPAVIFTAEFDPLAHDGRDYAAALAADGVPVTYRCWKGTIHGFLNFYSFMPKGRRAIAQGARALRQAFRADPGVGVVQ